MPVLKEIDDPVPLIPKLVAELTKAAIFSNDPDAAESQAQSSADWSQPTAERSMTSAPHEVTTDDGRTYTARVVGSDSRIDLALIKVDGQNDFPFAHFADRGRRIGDWVLAVGNPFGLGGSVTAYRISAWPKHRRRSARRSHSNRRGGQPG
jgi:hypothetical protein